MKKNHLPKIHHDLVNHLSRDLKPVRFVKPTSYFLFWVVTSISIVMVATLIREDARELANKFADWRFTGSLIAVILSVVVTSWLAIRMSVPGEEPSRVLRLTMFVVPILLAGLFFVYWLSDSPLYTIDLDLGSGPSCALSLITIGLFPLVFLSFIAYRLAPMNTLGTSLMICLSSFLLSAAGAQMHCCDCVSANGCHIALWHYLPVFVGSMLLAFPLHYFLSRWKKI